MGYRTVWVFCLIWSGIVGACLGIWSEPVRADTEVGNVTIGQNQAKGILVGANARP